MRTQGRENCRKINPKEKMNFFDIQMARRLEEVHLIDLAMEEIKGKIVELS